MKLVVGLGNPGPAYAATRHNVGFWIVDRLAERHGLTGVPGEPLCGAIEGEEVVLLKPQTFMNRSGSAVARTALAFAVGPTEILVAYDDLDLPVGKVRLRIAGGAGGHRGVASIIETLGLREFPRLRVGIGRPPAGADVVDYVLEPPAPDQEEALAEAVDVAAAAVEIWLAEGIQTAMNRTHAPAAKAPPDASSG